MKKNVLILGASGFIGKKILELFSLNFSNISYLVHKTPIKNIDGFKIFGSLENLSFDSLEACNPDIVIHCARLNGSSIIGRYKSALIGYHSNISLLNKLEQLNKPILIIYISGSLMYGNNHNIVLESNNLNPISFAKQYSIAEKPFINKKMIQCRVTMVRPGWVIGNGSWFKRYYLDHIKSNLEIPCYGNPDCMMSIIDVNTLAKKVLSIACSKFYYPVYNPLGYEPITKNRFLNILQNVYNLNIVKKDIPYIIDKAIFDAFNSSILLGSDFNNAIDIKYLTEKLIYLKKETQLC